MENKQRQILSEITEISASIRSQLDILENKIEELNRLLDTSDPEQPIELDIDIPEIQEEDSFTANPFEDFPPSPLGIDEAVAAAPVESVPTPVMVADAADILLGGDILAQAEKQKQQVHSKLAVIDAMAEHQAWRTDMPGSSVKDIRSAISLNDRILFINTLFSGDAVLFQNTLSALNSMDTFDEAVSYLSKHNDDWNLDSDEVYRFMMAVRRRLH